VGTDGLDGNAGAAGAWVSPGLWAAAQQQGLSVPEHLARNDSAGFFGTLQALVHTGPTHTNVNDFRALLVRPAPAS
jgi:hydroxypyruvate reductase